MAERARIVSKVADFGVAKALEDAALDPRWSALVERMRADGARERSRVVSPALARRGYFYLAFGAVLLLAPTGVHEALFLTALNGYESGFTRVIGMSLAVIGWFYVMGGRTGTPSFALATVVDRLLVPFVLIPLALWQAVPPAAVLPVAILDPVLALGALWLWRKQASET